MKVRISLVICPECGAPMPSFDIYDTKLATAECPNCGKEFEVREKKGGHGSVITPKKVN